MNIEAPKPPFRKDDVSLVLQLGPNILARVTETDKEKSFFIFFENQGWTKVDTNGAESLATTFRVVRTSGTDHTALLCIVPGSEGGLLETEIIEFSKTGNAIVSLALPLIAGVDFNVTAFSSLPDGILFGIAKPSQTISPDLSAPLAHETTFFLKDADNWSVVPMPVKVDGQIFVTTEEQQSSLSYVSRKDSVSTMKVFKLQEILQQKLNKKVHPKIQVSGEEFHSVGSTLASTLFTETATEITLLRPATKTSATFRVPGKQYFVSAVEQASCIFALFQNQPAEGDTMQLYEFDLTDSKNTAILLGETTTDKTNVCFEYGSISLFNDRPVVFSKQSNLFSEHAE